MGNGRGHRPGQRRPEGGWDPASPGAPGDGAARDPEAWRRAAREEAARVIGRIDRLRERGLLD